MGKSYEDTFFNNIHRRFDTSSILAYVLDAYCPPFPLRGSGLLDKNLVLAMKWHFPIGARRTISQSDMDLILAKYEMR